jgi:hypothetical protein
VQSRCMQYAHARTLHAILTWLPSHTLVLCDPRFGAQLLFDFHPTPMFCVGVGLVAISVWFYARPDQIAHGAMQAVSRLSPVRLVYSSCSPSRAPPKALVAELAPASSASNRSSKDSPRLAPTT